MTASTFEDRRPASEAVDARPELTRHTATDLHAYRDPTQVRAPKPFSNLSLPRGPLIGRAHESAAIQQLLLQEQVGLLTLTGPGGIGKTRLAMQVAANLLDHFVDGVYFVALAPISDPTLVGAALAQTLGVREAAAPRGHPSLQESLQDYLRDRQLLLVLDNFEQILAAARLVSMLLTACRRLKVLVTSRASLHLYGEHEFPVPPLALPDAKRLVSLEKDPASSITAYAALELFCQRARAAKPDFALTPSNAVDVAKICVSLDGLPLAIELAAAKIKLFSPSALLARLPGAPGARLTLLTGGAHDLPVRQRTLRNEIAWSYDLLTASEQTLFRRLAVFVGGFTLEAAQAVGNADEDRAMDVLEGVATLVDQNLLKQTEQNGGEARFSLLETIREYGLEQLEASGEADALRLQHARFFLTVAEATAVTYSENYRDKWVKELLLPIEVDYANMRAALQWAAANSAAIELRLLTALSVFWRSRSYLSEGRHWLAEAITQRTPEPSPVYAELLTSLGVLCWRQGDFATAQAWLEESVALCRTIQDQRGLGNALQFLASVRCNYGDYAAARALAEESVSTLRRHGGPKQFGFALDTLAEVMLLTGDYATARVLREESLALFRASGDLWGIGLALTGLGNVAFGQADDASAYARYTEALSLQRQSGNPWYVAQVLLMLGKSAWRQGDTTQASALWEESLLHARAVGAKEFLADVQFMLGLTAQKNDDRLRAVTFFRESLTLFQGMGSQAGAAYALSALAGLSEQREWAAQVLGVTTVLLNTAHLSLDALERAHHEQTVAAVRMRLGEKAFAAWGTAGQALTLEQAIDDALALPESSASATPSRMPEPVTPAYPAGLTAREVDVLRLLAQGLTYAQIAEKLIISRRTVNGHVTIIYSKLGVNGRLAATRFAVDHHLV